MPLPLEITIFTMADLLVLAGVDVNVALPLPIGIPPTVADFATAAPKAEEVTFNVNKMGFSTLRATSRVFLTSLSFWFRRLN
jgi:hypothetical protein